MCQKALDLLRELGRGLILEATVADVKATVNNLNRIKGEEVAVSVYSSATQAQYTVMHQAFQDWAVGSVAMMVCTAGLGSSGIDVGDINWVLHASTPPGGLPSVLNGAGRCGRRGQACRHLRESGDAQTRATWSQENSYYTHPTSATTAQL